MTLIDQADRALAVAANQFAGRSIVLDRLVHDIIATALPTGGVLIAALCWIWFESDQTGVHIHRRNVVTALLAVMGVAGALLLLKALLPFRDRPLNDPDLGLRVPFGVDPTSLSDLSAIPSGHTAFFFALSVPLWKRSHWLGAASAVRSASRPWRGLNPTSDMRRKRSLMRLVSARGEDVMPLC